MKYVSISLFIFTSIFSSVYGGEDSGDCDNLEEARLRVRSVNRLADVAISSSVTLLEKEAVKNVEKAIGGFKVSTLGLAGKDITKEGMAEWYANMTNLNKLAFGELNKMDFMKNSGMLERTAATIVNGLVASWLTRAFGTTLHEKAHNDGQKAAGASDTWYVMGFGDSASGRMTLGELFMNLFTSGKRAGAMAIYPTNISDRENAGISAAGVNANTKFAEDMEKVATRYGYVHNTEMVHYFYNKLYLAGYAKKNQDVPGSDPRNYAEALVEQGLIKESEINKTVERVGNYALLSAVMSGRSWDMIRSNIEYITKGKTTVKTLGIDTSMGKVTLPDFNTYLNADSVSIKGTTSLVRDNGMIFSIAVERSVIGKDVSEYTVGVFVPLSERFTVDVNTRANDDRGWGLGTRLSYNLGKGWYLNGGFDFDQNTLEGDRINNSFDDDDVHVRTYVGAGFRF